MFQASRGSRCGLTLIGALLLVLGCSLFEDEENFEVQISASASVVSPSEPVTFTVTAENRGSSRVVWGKGSSTCQLTTVVQIEGREHTALDVTKWCTADLVEAGLDPGESRTEVFHWSGHVAWPDTFGVLPPGDYEVRGAAGKKARSAPVAIEVRG